MDNARIYFYITALSFPFLAVYNSCAALYRTMGNSKVSMKTSLLMNGINIVGNTIGVYVLHVGVAGVAVPTPRFACCCRHCYAYYYKGQPKSDIC